MNRREFGLGVAAFGLSSSALMTRDAIAADGGQIGTVSDGFLQLPTNFLLPNGIPEEVSGLSLSDMAASETLKVPCNVTAFRRPEGIVLFDCGSGPNFMPSAGLLPETLPEAGFDMSEVTDVIFTHAHPDHIWGVIDDFDELLFPDANYHIAETEWDFWRSDNAMSDVGEARQTFVIGARNRFDAIEERVNLFKPNAEVLPGIEALGAEGHTPGHMAFVLHSDTPTMVVGDAIANVPISFVAPDFPWGADQDPDMGAKTRRMLLDRLASDQMRFVGFHLPDGGIGRVERKGSAYQFVPGA